MVAIAPTYWHGATMSSDRGKAWLCPSGHTAGHGAQSGREVALEGHLDYQSQRPAALRRRPLQQLSVDGHSCAATFTEIPAPHVPRSSQEARGRPLRDG